MSGEKIPDDVMKAARLAVFEFETRIQSDEFSDPDGTGASEALARTFARAIMAERSARDERAAQIVERDAEDYWDVSCVAAAIRGER